MYMAAVQNSLDRFSLSQENTNKTDIARNMIDIPLSEHGFQTNVKSPEKTLAFVFSNGGSCMNPVLQPLRNIAENKLHTDNLQTVLGLR